MPSRSSLPITNFQNPDGSPVAKGYLRIRISQNASISFLIPGPITEHNQIQSNFTKVSLDSSGNVTGSPTFWANADLSPSGTYYILEVFSSTGQLLSGPSKLTI